MRVTSSLAVLVAVVLAASSSEGAAPRGAAERLASGERVFVGDVIGVSTRWGEGRKMIWTDYLFAVEETWTGTDAPRQVVSVAGGTVDGETILVTHGARFEVGETYLVSAWGNEHLYSSAVVDGDRAYYRRVVDEATSAEVFLDPEDRRMEARPDGVLVPGRLSAPAGKPGFVRFPSDEEFAYLLAQTEEKTAALVPVYLDPSGRRIAPFPAPAAAAAPETCTASRSDLRSGMERVRKAASSSRGVK
jgi:hypothetical protein